MKKEIFDFSEALKRMRKGKLVKRENGLYPFGIDEEGIFYHYGHHIYKEERMLSEDIIATDWEEVLKMEKKILTLNVSKQWFDMIVSGEKTEEYREIKPYWASRLVNQQVESGEVLFDEFGGYCLVIGKPEYKPYTHVLFINGYRKDSPRIQKEIESIAIGKPKKGLCPDKWLDKEFFVIKFK
jgi:hypothetical protein